jgi:hypothetical protein
VKEILQIALMIVAFRTFLSLKKYSTVVLGLHSVSSGISILTNRCVVTFPVQLGAALLAVAAAVTTVKQQSSKQKAF